MEREGAKNLLPSETAMDYLYIIGMENTSLTASERKDRDYLMGLATQRPAAFTIYGKARYATILALQGEKAKAKEYLQSLKEYSVYREDIGKSQGQGIPAKPEGVLRLPRGYRTLL